MSSTTPTTSQEHAPPQHVEAAAAGASDPADDVDDLDDLDDVLDEFNQPSTSSAIAQASAQPAPSTAAHSSSSPVAAAPSSKNSAAKDSDTAGAASTSAGDDAENDDLDDILSQDFAKELAQGMEALMKELGSQAGVDGAPAAAGASGSADAATQDFNEQELMRQFEAMMAGFGGAGAGTGAGAANPASASSTSKDREQPTASGSGTAKPGNFNDAIAATLAKLKESDASASATNSSASDNPFAALGGADGEEMAKLLAALGGGEGGDGAGALDNPELAKMLEGMMDELMSRDILYEPLKELRDKYPAYLSGPDSASISAVDRTRYQQQSTYIAQIVEIFDDPKYDAKNKAMTSRIQDLMNQMQDCGSPPKEIVGDMPPELENFPGFGGSGNPNDDCTVM
ncbi:Pex19-domain-containing protein [Testicularia cyperi]|uniref:Pex19-domain-containing protein n=1 Tax=Testicularia cyperi TaxID=1882483 RepID=A0A317XV93_9BASI|nr:Pex19-domain-containing protein [Testicularia cyperi]